MACSMRPHMASVRPAASPLSASYPRRTSLIALQHNTRRRPGDHQNLCTELQAESWDKQLNKSIDGVFGTTLGTARTRLATGAWHLATSGACVYLFSLSLDGCSRVLTAVAVTRLHCTVHLVSGRLTQHKHCADSHSAVLVPDKLHH